jgi:ATP-binding cassette, subfamily B, bacterial
LPRRLAATALAYAAQLVLFVVAWGLVGARATAGGATTPWVAELLFVLGALLGTRFLASWGAGRLAIDAGELLRRRLMEGLLALDTEPLRAEGIGQLLGRVMETEAVESLALGGGLLAMAGTFELVTGAVVLALGARGPVQLALLALVLAGAAVLALRFWRALARWSALRLGLTHDLVERMVGHRTLVAQQPPELRHVDESRALTAYERAGLALDRGAAALAVVVPRAWLLAGVAGLATAFAAAGALGPVATSLGGVLLVYGALRKLTHALPTLASAAIAWRQVAPLFAGAGAAAPLESDVVPPTSAGPLVAARDLGFQYPGRTKPALAACSFEIHRGDRILLEGSSGGGKSTLATLLAGLRAPDAGTLALDGVAQSTLGLPRWRERVGVVPQFHENHVFSASLIFNLLMGRAWPPSREDVTLAEQVCRELDLGGVLARMPSGLEQLVGESGWQLSHGERSRLFIARSLLQRLDLRILDESFAALDPETLERVLGCVLARAETVVVIAHP